MNPTAQGTGCRRQPYGISKLVAEKIVISFNHKNYGPWQFTVFRIVFGLYLAVHFASLIPDAQEVFGPEGTIADPSGSLAWKILPNVLIYFASDQALQGFLIGLTLLSLAYAAGIARQVLALFLLYGWACLFNRNIFIANPSLPYVGWLLLASAVIKSGEPLSQWPKSKPDWKMNPWIFNGAWLILIIGYSFSGIQKAMAESWQNGHAIQYILELPTARDYWFKYFILSMPDIVLKLITWSALLLEILFLPLCMVRKTRTWAVLAMIGMHLGILSTVSTTDLTFGMLMIHFFVVEPDWGIQRAKKKVVFFDGVCGLCDIFVTFMVDADRENTLKFATQQGEAFQELKSRIDPSMGDSVFYLRGEKLYSRSTAALFAISDMGGIWKLSLLFFVVPRVLRNLVYDFVARNRYRVFGKRESCRVPTPEERARFIA